MKNNWGAHWALENRKVAISSLVRIWKAGTAQQLFYPLRNQPSHLQSMLKLTLKLYIVHMKFKANFIYLSTINEIMFHIITALFYLLTLLFPIIFLYFSCNFLKL